MNNWLQQLNWRLAQAMEGRNGPDSLARASIIASIVLALLGGAIAGSIAILIGDALLIYGLFRCFSRNIDKRRSEAESFDLMIEKPKRSIELAIKKFKNRKTTCYFTCEECKTVYSAPKGKGKIKTTCPHCHKQSIHTT